jgi:D-3-phosphoglycerate dehydrogenase / 2-oxoglutarate reductase
MSSRRCSGPWSRRMADRFRILLADQILASGLEPLQDPRFELIEATGLKGDALAEALCDVDAVVVRSTTTIDAAALATTQRLKVIGRAGVGVDNIDVDAATARGIAVFNAPSGNTISAAELTMALMLAAMRRVAAADRAMRSGVWDRKRYKGSELHGKVLALIGAGRIGGEVARRARSFGMRIIASDPFLQEERARQLGIDSVSLEQALSQGDVISLHVPLTDETANLLDRDRIGLLKPTAIIVNAARGGVVDEDALAEALREGRIAGAALDVFATEPLDPDSPLRGLDNVVLTPHIGAATVEAQHNVAYEVSEAVRDALLHEEFAPAVNAPAVGTEQVRRLRPLLDLATRLGRVGRALAGNVQAVELRYAGESDDEALRPLTAAAMLGMLLDVVGRGGVNLVSALHLAEARGIRISRVLLEPHPDFGERVELRIAGGGRETLIAGALRGEHPRIIRIDAFPIEVRPRGVLVILRNRDVPGVIGRVGTLLGGAAVNIGEYHQGRVEAGGEAMAAIAIDQKLSMEVLDALRRLPDIIDVHQVSLD